MMQTAAPTVVTISFASADYRTGQHDARGDFQRDPGAAPDRDLLARYRSADYADGYTREWYNLSAAQILADEPRSA